MKEKVSFLKIKPTELELKRLKSRKKFSERGKNLLEIKREQLYQQLQDITEQYFKERHKIRKSILDEYEHLEFVYGSVGKMNLKNIAILQEKLYSPKLDIKFIKEMGITVPKIHLDLDKDKFPSYSFIDTSIHLDKVIKDMRELLERIISLAALDSKLYSVSQEYLKIQRRINSLEDVIIPKLEKQIKKIEEIMADNRREEFIRMKKIKDKISKDMESEL